MICLNPDFTILLSPSPIDARYRACSHHPEFGGTGTRTPPCVERWCRARAAQRDADKAERAARRKGHGTSKRPMDSRYMGSIGDRHIFSHLMEDIFLFPMIDFFSPPSQRLKKYIYIYIFNKKVLVSTDYRIIISGNNRKLW